MPDSTLKRLMTPLCTAMRQPAVAFQRAVHAKADLQALRVGVDVDVGRLPQNGGVQHLVAQHHGIIGLDFAQRDACRPNAIWARRRRPSLAIDIDAIEGPFQRFRLGRLGAHRHRQKPLDGLQRTDVEHIGAGDVDAALCQGERQHLAAQGHLRRHPECQSRIDFDLVHVEQSHAIGVGGQLNVFDTADQAVLSVLKPNDTAFAEDHFPRSLDVEFQHGIDGELQIFGGRREKQARSCLGDIL